MTRRNGMRESHLKRFSSEMINTGPTQNAAVVMEYHDRARSLRLGDWVHIGPDTAALRAVKDKIDAIKAQAVPEQCIFLINKPKIRTMRMYYETAGSRAYYFLEDDYLARTFKRSIFYPDREVALNRFQFNKIRWREEITVPLS